MSIKTKINGKSCKVHLIDEVERLKSDWGIWTCHVEFLSEWAKCGTIQANAHMCAPETFEEDDFQEDSK